MSSKNVALRAEVVEILDRAKRPGESYSDVILRLAPRRRPFEEILEELRREGEIGNDELDRRLREIRSRGNRWRKLKV